MRSSNPGESQEMVKKCIAALVVLPSLFLLCSMVSRTIASMLYGPGGCSSQACCRTVVGEFLCIVLYVGSILACFWREIGVSVFGSAAKIFGGSIAALFVWCALAGIDGALVERIALILLAVLGIAIVALYGSCLFNTSKNTVKSSNAYLDIAVAMLGVLALVLAITDSSLGW